MDNILTVPIHLKMTLTAREAAEYSNIGINKIDSMLRSPNCPFVLFVGTKKLVENHKKTSSHRLEVFLSRRAQHHLCFFCSHVSCASRRCSNSSLRER